MDLLRGYSVEVTPSDAKSIDAAAMMDPGAEVFIPSLRSDSGDSQVLAAARLKRSGLIPVPHLVARNIKNPAELAALLRRLRQEAGVERALVLAGDRDQPAGAFSSSLQLLETGALGEHGIRTVYLSWYPEGHPRIGAADLAAARTAKLAAAAKAGFAVTLVSQFCFEAAPIISMARQIRSEGVTVPLRVGVAGPASRLSLLKYAVICGVGASIRALKERPASRSLLAGDTPEDLLREVAAAQAANPALGIQGVHFFTFGSLAATAEFVEKHRQSKAQPMIA